MVHERRGALADPKSGALVHTGVNPESGSAPALTRPLKLNRRLSEMRGFNGGVASSRPGDPAPNPPTPPPGAMANLENQNLQPVFSGSAFKNI